ncbi:MAG: glycerophosphodiester phosphodiesterase [Clostridium sp.]|uniref:glycerophosphodiester phosphodiesterase n=1 Tax=Clostridium sp. TaxID=1506 RepID=UPI003F2EA9B7
MEKILNLAHRGYSYKYPENTMIAFKKAVEFGADGMEFDVQRSKDGHLVIIHDETLERTTTGKGYVKDYTLEELKKLDAGIKFDESFKGEEIPTLEELLEYVQDKNLVLNIEIKNSIVDYEGIEEEVYKVLKKYNMEKNIIVSTFNHYSAKRCKEINKNIKVGVLYDACIYKPYDYVEMLKLDAIHPEYHSVTKEIAEECIKRNIDINVYTVNLEEDMQKLKEISVNSIITNKVEDLKRILEAK